MQRLVNIFISIYLWGFTLSAWAQIQPNNLVHYGELDGTIIYDILNDRSGNIWLATQNGLVRFDGYDFKRFYSDPNDSTTISSILAFSLLEDRLGRIWVGSIDAINVYDPVTDAFRHYDYIQLTDYPEYSQSGIFSMTSDSSGRIYFGISSAIGIMASHALVYYDPVTDRIMRYDYPDNLVLQGVTSLTTGKDDKIWLITVDGLFRIGNGGNLNRYDLPVKTRGPSGSFAPVFSHITSDLDGTIWISSNQSRLYSFNPESGTYESYSLENLFESKAGPVIINQIHICDEHDIWLASNQGLIRFDRLKRRFETLNDGTERNYGRSPINCLHCDEFGNLWIGTSSNGLLKYNNKNALKSILGSTDKSSPITAGWVNSIRESRSGKVWFTTLGEGSIYSGLNELNLATGTIVKRPYSTIRPGLDAIFDFIELRPGQFLVSSNQGLFNYEPDSNAVTKVNLKGLPDSIQVSKFHRDARGKLWILSSTGTYLEELPGSGLRHFDLRQLSGSSVGSNQLTDIFESEKYGIWLLSNDGLFQYHDQTGQIDRHGHDREREDLFIAQDINSFYIGDDGVAWVGTWQGGLSRYDLNTGEIRSFTTGDGLPSMSIQGILVDEKGSTVWLSTFEGLSSFDITKEQFSNFTLDDGIQSLLFADASCLKTSKGLFVFGGSKGITYFNPIDIQKQSMPPKVYITDFKIGDKSLSAGLNPALKGNPQKNVRLVLKYFQKNISISYIGIHYANPSRNRYAYMLENYDEGWREVGNLRTAYYYNLPPGDYSFHVKAANTNGTWNEEGASIVISITPPWWKTWWAYALYVLLFLYIAHHLDQWRRRRVMRKLRASAREKELQHAREIEKAYRKLQTTQTQLLHAEKMASLGELTAGIAHEIQNPLNFVSNFSEVSIELMKELETEMATGNGEEARSLLADLKQNLEKISRHGMRASSIVKGMLEHSRAVSGQKEPVNINAMADEYLRLAYHGLRAKNKTFNADFRTDFDDTLNEISVVPQDMGRVLLNLINNAFYAVSQKASGGNEEFKPTVTVITRRMNGMAEIRVIDNGDGIPAGVLDKIFQPFFTTKPAGEGTGLGLSLSYDIVTKGHGGELKVETKEGEGTEFIVIIPA